MRRDPFRSVSYIVSDEHAFAYFTLQKVACSSIKTALLPLFPDLVPEAEVERGMRDGTFAYRVHRFFANSDHEVKRGPFLEGLESGHYDDHFKFAFVRNPWDRLLSCWKQKLAPGGQGLNRTEYAGVRLHVGMDFPAFVEAICLIPDEQSNPHWRSQHVVVCGGQGRILADFVGRFERLEDDFFRVASEIGADLRLPRLLSSGGESYQDYYDSRLARIVGSVSGPMSKYSTISFRAASTSRPRCLHVRARGARRVGSR